MQSKTSAVTLYGAGGHCGVVIDILRESGISEIKVTDDNPDTDIYDGCQMTEPTLHYERAIITIGNCAVRRKIAERIIADEYVTAIHPSSIISPTAHVGEGSVIVQGAILQAHARIGRHCIVNTKASVGHDVIAEDFVHIASGATVCGGARIGEGTWIGAGSVVKQRVNIGKDCMIGAGSIVVSDIPDNVVAYGNPCRIVRENTL